MELTPNERFPYPDGNDPGNGALDLQALAESIDAKAQIQLTNFRTKLNKKMRVARLIGTGPNSIGANAFGDVFTMGAGQWSILIDTTGTFLLDASSLNGFGPEPGIFRVGCHLSSNPVGVVTANTYRELRISATVPTNDPSLFPANTTIKRSLSKVFEASTGFVSQTCELEFATLFPAQGANVVTTVNVEFQHGNTGSNVQLLASTLLYTYRVCDIEVL